MTFLANIISALPYFFLILSAHLTLKKLVIVSIPSFLAIFAIFLAGSTPKTFLFFFLKGFKKVPSLLAISTINKLFLDFRKTLSQKILE